MSDSEVEIIDEIDDGDTTTAMLHDGFDADRATSHRRLGRPPRPRLDRKTRARVAALTMHARHPDAAKRNGRKGGRRTAENYKDGPRVWATRMALARWHGVRFDYEPSAERTAERRI